MIEPKRIGESIKVPVIVGVGLLVLTYLANFGISFLIKDMESTLQEPFFYVLLAIPYIIFFPLFLWTGYRSVKKYNSTLLEAGLATAAVALLVKVIEFFIGLVISLIIIMFLGGTMSDEVAGVMTVLAFSSVMMGIMLCLVQLLFSIPMNFVVGVLGGYIAGARKFTEEKKEEKQPKTRK